MIQKGKTRIGAKLFCIVLITVFGLILLQVPTASVTIEGASALNRVRWSSGGKEVAVGDSEGRVWIYDTGEVRASDHRPHVRQVQDLSLLLCI